MEKTVEQQAAVIREAGYRITRARLTVLQVLAQSDEALDAAAIYALGREINPRLGRVSVYRTLELLNELGLARKVHGTGSCHGYARARRQTGHYLVCQRCGQVIEFPCAGLDELVEQVGRQYDFRVEEHLLQLGGVCRDCYLLGRV